MPDEGDELALWDAIRRKVRCMRYLAATRQRNTEATPTAMPPPKMTSELGVPSAASAGVEPTLEASVGRGGEGDEVLSLCMADTLAGKPNHGAQFTCISTCSGIRHRVCVWVRAQAFANAQGHGLWTYVWAVHGCIRYPCGRRGWGSGHECNHRCLVA